MSQYRRQGRAPRKVLPRLRLVNEARLTQERGNYRAARREQREAARENAETRQAVSS